MTTTEWLINIALILVVILQFRPRKLDLLFVVVPVGLVAFTAFSFLKTVPVSGHDPVLIGALVAVGVLLGIGGGLATQVTGDAQGRATVRGTMLAAALWIVGVGGRIAFVLWTEHGGEGTVTSFSKSNHITGSDAWTAALVLMALSEVIVRLGIIVIRGRRVAALAPVAAAA